MENNPQDYQTQEQLEVEVIKYYCEAFNLIPIENYDEELLGAPEGTVFPIVGDGNELTPDIYLDPSGQIFAQFGLGVGPVWKQEGGMQPVTIEHIILSIETGVAFLSDVGNYEGSWLLSARKAYLREYNEMMHA